MSIGERLTLSIPVLGRVQGRTPPPQVMMRPLYITPTQPCFYTLRDDEIEHLSILAGTANPRNCPLNQQFAIDRIRSFL
jgi:hypothetical protein